MSGKEKEQIFGLFRAKALEGFKQEYLELENGPTEPENGRDVLIGDNSVIS